MCAISEAPNSLAILIRQAETATYDFAATCLFRKQQYAKRRRSIPAELIAQAKKPHAPQRKSLHNAIRSRVYRFALCMVGQEGAAATARHILLHVFRELHRFSADERFDVWLFRIVAADCQQLSRTKFRNGGVDDRPPPAESTSTETYRKFILSLKPKNRTPWLLKQIEDFRNEEIASILNISGGAVAARLANAEEQLAEMTGGKGASELCQLCDLILLDSIDYVSLVVNGGSNRRQRGTPSFLGIARDWAATVRRILVGGTA